MRLLQARSRGLEARMAAPEAGKPVKIYAVYTEEYLSDIQGMHQREWAADWHAYKLAVKYFEKDTLHAESEEWCVRWVSEPWAGYPGWAFGPYASESYSYVVPVGVTVP
jgi:hypothetical protein